jgi:phenylacetate-CoA ligase
LNESLARWLYFLAQDLRGERVRAALRELRETEQWPEDRLRRLQWERLQALVGFAWENVPFYRTKWSAAGFAPGDLKTEDDWRRLPPLTREDLRDRGAELRAPRRRPGLIAATSGSSGQPVTVDRSHASWAYAHAAMFRGWGWQGLRAGDRHAYFWGVPLDPAAARTARRKDRLFNRERLNAFRIDAGSSRAFFERMRRHSARFALGYPSALAAFAREIREAGLDGRALGWRAALTTAEVLHDHQRELLEETFGARVADAYGCAEVGMAGVECESGGMHVPVEAVVVDQAPVESGAAAGAMATDAAPLRTAEGDAAELLLTDLANRNQPIIRYRVGDLVEPVHPAACCPCGRFLPLLGRVSGRAGDTLILPDGRRVNANLPSYIFKHHARQGTVHEYQFVQEPSGRVELRVVRGPNWSDSINESLASEVRSVLGLEVVLRPVDRIPRRGRAKHRDFVRSEDLEDETNAGRSGSP